MTNSIWDDTAVVGVTPAIYNDTISVSKTSPIMDDDFKAALSEAFINIGNTEEGKEVIAIYSHNGYLPARLRLRAGRPGDDPVPEQRGLNPIKHRRQTREGGRGFPPSFGMEIIQ